MKNEPSPDFTNPGPTSPTEACARVRARLPELVDGGLAPLEEARDQGHLEACAACAAEAASWRDLHAGLGVALGGPSLAPPGLAEALAARLDDVEIAPPPREPVVLRPLQSLVAAAASLVLLFGLEALGSAMDLGEEARAILRNPAPAGLESELRRPSLDLPLYLPGLSGPDGAELQLEPADLLEVLR